MGERVSCRAYCQSCGLKIYAVEGLPEGSKAEVERLLVWMRANMKGQHQLRGCKELRMRWEWSPFRSQADKHQARLGQERVA